MTSGFAPSSAIWRPRHRQPAWWFSAIGGALALACLGATPVIAGLGDTGSAGTLPDDGEGAGAEGADRDPDDTTTGVCGTVNRSGGEPGAWIWIVPDDEVVQTSELKGSEKEDCSEACDVAFGRSCASSRLGSPVNGSDPGGRRGADEPGAGILETYLLVVGSYQDPGVQPQPVVWESPTSAPPFTAKTLDTLAGGEGQAHAVVKADDVWWIGGDTKGPAGCVRPCVWTRQCEDGPWILTVLPVPAGSCEASVRDVFDFGPAGVGAVGYADDAKGVRIPFLWRYAAGAWTPDPLPVPGDLPGRAIAGFWRSGRAQIVGHVDCTLPSSCGGLLWDWTPGGGATVTPLDPTLGPIYRPTDILPYGPTCGVIITGTVLTGTGMLAERIPVLQYARCAPGGVLDPVDLNALLSEPYDGVLRTADAITAGGHVYVTGDATTTGGPSFGNAYLWTSDALLDAPDVVAVAPLIAATPNPVRRSVRLTLPEGAAGADVRVFDAGGRVVRELAGGRVRAWDRTDSAGRRVPDGVYFVRATWPSGVSTAKLVVDD